MNIDWSAVRTAISNRFAHDDDADMSARDYWDNLVDVVKSPIEGIWLSAVVVMVVILAMTYHMWSLNLDREFGWVGFYTIIGNVVLLAGGYKPTHVAIALIFHKPIQWLGSSASGLSIHNKIVMVLCLGWNLIGLTLMAIPFANAPGTFWVFWVVISGLIYVNQVYPSASQWTGKIITGYLLVIAVAAVFNFVNAPARDLHSGEPTYMGHYTTTSEGKTEFLRDFGITPAQCRPEGVAHEGFDYTKNGTCKNQWGEGNLVPEPMDAATNREVGHWTAKVTSATGLPLWMLVAAIGLIAYVVLSKKTARGAIGGGTKSMLGIVLTLAVLASVVALGWWVYSNFQVAASSSPTASVVAGTDCRLYGLGGLPEVIVPNKDDPVKQVYYDAKAGQPFVLNLSRLSISSDARDNEYMFDVDQIDPQALDASGKSRPATEFFTRQVCLDNGVGKVKMTPNTTIKMLAYDADLK